MKSRHGVYYLRLVLPEHKAHQLGRRPGEVRLSLRTKCKKEAKVRLAEKLSRMVQEPTELEPWEAQYEADRARFERGLVLIEQYGRIDPQDQFRFDALCEQLSLSQQKDYVFALEYDERQHDNVGSREVKPPVTPPLDD
jgi:hypothetical protein